MGLDLPDELPLIREHVAALRGQGADLVALLSNRVIAPPEQRTDGPLALAGGRDGLSPG
jgi:hypothetical protein